MAEWNGLDLRRRLASADRFKDSAMLRALRAVKTPGRRSIASLFLDTATDHLRTRVGRAFLGAARLRESDLAADFRDAMRSLSGVATPLHSHRGPSVWISMHPKGMRVFSDRIRFTTSGHVLVELTSCPGPVLRMHERSPALAFARIDAIVLAPAVQPPHAIVGDVPLEVIPWTLFGHDVAAC
jgi:hypothetical protein